ncbi:hypothetical protein H5410_051018 [Solanum commersonii]|uniref:Uncharacterized protein n=1 Tax=Solanum commersonii TaxID=4109 RepID=A0A9J5WYE5_SOLCO|nr:hypothetical protein H5410_051018 [Solanum commersonii]
MYDNVSYSLGKKCCFTILNPFFFRLQAKIPHCETSFIRLVSALSKCSMRIDICLSDMDSNIVEALRKIASLPLRDKILEQKWCRGRSS